MVGVDIVSIERIKRAKNIETKICSAAELEHLQKYISDGNKTQRYFECLAGMFASKEAVLKAFSQPIGLQKLKQIEVLHHDNGAPYVVLSKNFASIVGKNMPKTIHISISHDAGMAISVCFLQP